MTREQPKPPPKPGKGQKKQLEPWDRRPWPQTGDTDVTALYASIGCALTAWERYESELAFLFSQFVCIGGPSRIHPAMRAYCAVRTYHGRIEMLKAASESFFHGFGMKGDNRLVKDFKSMLNPSCRFNDRRNDIAHGVVDSFIPEALTIDAARKIAGKLGHALFPTYGYFKDHTPEGYPLYCYTSTEINHFREQFISLLMPTHTLAAEISGAADAILMGARKKSGRA